MAKRKRTQQQQADRALCPPPVAQAVGLKSHQIAEAMRQAGVSEPLTIRQVKAWKAMRAEPPTWFAELLAKAAARAARREHRKEMREFEAAHRQLLLEDKVARRLLAGAIHLPGTDAELVAADMAFRAMKELVRVDGDAELLCALDQAALRWAGVDVHDRGTWFLQAGGD